MLVWSNHSASKLFPGYKTRLKTLHSCPKIRFPHDFTLSHPPNAACVRSDHLPALLVFHFSFAWHRPRKHTLSPLFCLHRYKLVELAFYLSMGFFPASVVTSMVIYIFINTSTITFSLILKPWHHVFISADKPNICRVELLAMCLTSSLGCLTRVHRKQTMHLKFSLWFNDSYKTIQSWKIIFESCCGASSLF